MKKLIFKLVLLSIFISNVSFPINESFRSRTSGVWTTPSTWEFSTDGGTTWNESTILFPVVSSSFVTIRSPNVVTINTGTPLAIDQFTIDAGGTLSLEADTRLTINGVGNQLTLFGTITGSGSIKTSGVPQIDIRNGSSFIAPLVLDSGDVNIINSNSPFIAEFRGTISVSTSRAINVIDGYGVRAFNDVTNNGLITGPSAVFRMRGNNLLNTGNISIAVFNFDTTTFLDGGGIWNSPNINVNSSGNVTINDTVVFGSTGGTSVNINSGGVINGSGQYLLLNGTVSQVMMIVNANGTVGNSSSTNIHTRGNVVMNVLNSGIFNAALYIKTGITTSANNFAPFLAVYNGPIIIDAGGTFKVKDDHFALAKSIVINNGTISGIGSTFTMRGPLLTNNGSMNPTAFNFDSTTSLEGTGSWGIAARILSGSTVTLASNHQMQSIIINSGGIFNLSVFILLLTSSNPIVNNGTFTASNGAVEYNGTSNQSISTTNITYNRLRINNSAGTTLSGAVTVNDTLSVILGDLDLNGSILTISPVGYLTETVGNTVKGSAGYITTTRTLNTPSSLNVGGLGAILTTNSNLGSTEIRRGHAVQSGLSVNTSILRYFDITPSTNTGLNATLIFNYDESELNGKIESALSLFRSTNSGSTWTVEGGTVNTSGNNITLTGIDAYSRWSASNTGPVAVQLKVIMEGFYNLALVPNRLNMRDTVRAYLRDTSSSNQFAIVDSAKSIIDSNSFIGNFLFANTATGRYYIQLKHRNSIETWSKANGEAYTLGNSLVYDFTTSASQAFGNNMTLKASKFCIYSGDVNQDGIVDGSDAAIVDNDAFNFLGGYIRSDVNGDRFVDGSDGAIVDNNAFNFVNVVRP